MNSQTRTSNNKKYSKEFFTKPGGFLHHCLLDEEAYSELDEETEAKQWNQHSLNC